MKKSWPVLCFALTLLMFTTSCTSHAGDEFARVLEERWTIVDETQDPNAPAPIPVDIVPYENGDFAPTLGFDLVSYPSHEGLLVQNFYALDGWIGQIEYEGTDGFAPVLRVATTASDDLHTTYANLAPGVGIERSIDDIDVQVHHVDEITVMAYWLRGDFQYLLHLNKSADEVVDPVIEEFVTMVDSRMV